MRGEPDFFSSRLTDRTLPCAALRRLRCVMLITGPNRSSSCVWTTRLLVCGACLSKDSSQWSTGSRALIGCPCLPSCHALSPWLRYACHQRYAVERLVCTPACFSASCH